AYVIYTSGSTGKPKGVVIPHRAVVSFLGSMGKEPGLTEKDVLLAVTSLSFDIAVLELFLPLSVGAQLELVSRGTALDGQQLSAQLARSGATVMQATPVTWRLLVETGWQGNLQLKALCGGEALPRDLASELLTRCGSLWNMYGPTETTVWSTVSKIEADKSIDIGRPIDNTQIYILDEHLQPVPVGIAGELYIGGLGLARGYLNDPELTAAQFIPDPFSDVPNARLYKTGDLARYLPDGNIEWLGRRDRQVKIRGFRIELGEVEATLRQHPAVADAAAIVLGRHDSGPFSPEMTDRRLAAYVVPKRDHTASTEALRTFLGDRLPSYMIPATWASVDALPLTPNGKLDRRALAELEQAHVDETHSIVLPRDALERQMVEIWEQVLEVRRIGVRDSFFELGGHSLLAVRLFAQVEQRMKIKLPVATLFRSPTVERLCEAIRTGHALGWKAVVPIQIEGSQPPLFCVHGLGGGVLGYAELARLLGRDQPFYGLQARGLDGAEPPHTRIEEMAAYYVEAVRTVRPAGPYRLGGYSFGGVVAFEMARQLHAQGAYVDLVALFDTYAPLPLGIESQLWRPVALARFLRNLPRWLGDILRRQDGTQRLRTRIRLAARAAWRQANPRESAPLSDALVMEILGEGADATEEHRRVLEAHLEALESYRPQIYPGRVTLFRVPGMRLLRASDDAFGWGKLAAGGVTVRKVTGAHYSILESPAVEALAAELRDSLHEAREPQPDDLPQPDR
ncbi:MAG: amino acid adenylation domain-containing protein, partial [Anaerolineae bacterium]